MKLFSLVRLLLATTHYDAELASQAKIQGPTEWRQECGRGEKETRMNTFSLARELEKSVGRTAPEIETSEAIKAARAVLLQGLELLFELRDQTYSQVGFITGTSIGHHYGQIIQHFRSWLQGCRAGEIHYDACEGNVRLQTEVVYASIAICDVLRALKRYSPEIFDRQSYVSGRPGPNGKENFASTLSRELAYCTANAIQRSAVIRAICEELGIGPLDGFRSAATSPQRVLSTANS